MAFHRSLKIWFARKMGLLPRTDTRRERARLPAYRTVPGGQTQCPQCGTGTLRCTQERTSVLREFFDCAQCGARFHPPWGSYSVAEELVLRGGPDPESSDEYQWC